VATPTHHIQSRRRRRSVKRIDSDYGIRLLLG
jgi:hypothetical protein